MSWDDHETCRKCGARDCVGGLACLDRVDAQRKAKAPQPAPTGNALAYGSDNAGGVHLHVGDARVHLTHAEALDLARGRSGAEYVAELDRGVRPLIVTGRADVEALRRIASRVDVPVYSRPVDARDWDALAGVVGGMVDDATG